MKSVLSVILVGMLVAVFCSLTLAEEKKESMMGKSMMQGGMMGQQGMTGEEGMMGKGKMMGMGNMCGMMMNSMMTGKSLVATSDGGVILLVGNKLQKFDKDLNLKKELEINIDMESMQKMMEKYSIMQQQGGTTLDAKSTCAQEWLNKAIELHEIHMKDPSSATEASQAELMDQIKKAYECLTGSGVKEISHKTHH